MPAHPGAWQVFGYVTYKHPTLSALCQAGLANKVADTLSWVLLPVYLHTQGVGLLDVGWITGAYGLSWGVSQLWTGALSDRVGRKPPVVAGLWMLGAGIAAAVTVHGVRAWGVSAVVMGVGMALLYPNLIAAVADIAHPDWRGTALGTYRYWRDTGYAIGALVLGVVAQARGDVALAFWVTAAWLALSGAWVLWRADETHPGHPRVLSG